MINLIQGFNIGSATPIDGRILLSKEEMRNINDNVMPDRYFAFGKEDGKLYLYDKMAEVDAETGKFYKATPEAVSELVNDAHYDVKEDAENRELELRNYVEGNFPDNDELEETLKSYALVDETGNKLRLHWDAATYEFYLTLLDKNGKQIDETMHIDLPLETMVIGASYDAITKEIVLELKDGQTIRFSVADLVSGLINETTFNTHVNNSVAHTTTAEKSKWDDKYDLPEGGIPSDDLDASVNASLDKANSAIQQADLDENYYNKTETDSKLNEKQDNLEAGENIVINGTTISAIDTTYAAGTGINIEDNVISATAAAPTWASIEGDDPTVNEALANELSKYANKVETEAELAKKALATDLQAHTGNSAIHVTEANKEAWNNKYDKPSAGIPSVDMDSNVQASLSKADSALQEHQSLAEYRKSADQDVIDNKKVDKVVGKGLSTNDYTSAEKIKLSGIAEGAQVNVIESLSLNGVDIAPSGKKLVITGVASSSDVDDIKSLIPTDASSVNKLTSEDFVNSSIATSTATFRGTVYTKDELKDLSGDVNDYAFLVVIDEVTLLTKQYDRYKYTNDDLPETGHWVYEYTLNNSSFTAEQWAAINSGATTDLLDGFSSSISDLSTNKVDKVANKSLVLNSEISRLSNMSTGANKTTVANEGSGNIEIDGTSKNVYTHPTGSAQSGFNKLTSDAEGHVTGGTPVVANDITSLVSYSAGSGLKSVKDGVNNEFSTTYADNISLQVADWIAKTDGSSEDVQYYYQTKSNIEGITINSTPILDVVITKNDYASVDAINEAWSKIFSAETGSKSITFYATEKPEIAITVQAKCY